MKQAVLALPLTFVLFSCAAYQAQHGGTVAPRPQQASATPSAPAPRPEAFDTDPLAMRQAMLLGDLDRYMKDLESAGKYNCCVKPACRQCALTAGECHCRAVISANGPCCGECTQAWVEGRGDAPGVDREAVLEHLGCVRELYEKATPEGIEPPGQRKETVKPPTDASESHHH